jgi:membrane-bound ClpP family serine protease
MKNTWLLVLIIVMMPFAFLMIPAMGIAVVIAGLYLVVHELFVSHHTNNHFHSS